MGACFCLPTPTHGMEVLRWVLSVLGPYHPYKYCHPHVSHTESQGKNWSYSPSIGVQLLKQECHSEKNVLLSLPPASGPRLRNFCPGGEAGLKTESAESLIEGVDFLCNRVWRCLNIRALSKTVEVVMKSHWEEIGRWIGNTGRTIDGLVFWRVTEKETPGRNPLGGRTNLNIDLRNWSFKRTWVWLVQSVEQFTPQSIC